MRFLGIGTPELLLILLLIVLVLGPERSREAGAAAGRFIRRMTRSEFWRELVQAAHFMQHLPQNLVRLAELEELTSRLTEDVSSVQRELQEVAQPLQRITPARVFQEPLRAVESMDRDLRQAISGGRPAAPDATPPAPAVEVPAPGPQATAAGPQPQRESGPYSSVPGWAGVLQRLDAIERRQDELAGQLHALQSAVAPAAEPPLSDESM